MKLCGRMRGKPWFSAKLIYPSSVRTALLKFISWHGTLRIPNLKPVLRCGHLLPQGEKEQRAMVKLGREE